MMATEELIKAEFNGYQMALTRAKDWAVPGSIISEKMIPTLHALILADGQSKIKPSTYREDGDIASQMKSLTDWINASGPYLPGHQIASIAYENCMKICPFSEGSDKLAKLLHAIIIDVCGTGDVKPAVTEEIKEISAEPDKKELTRSLNLRQRKALKLFKEFETVSASQIGDQFNLKPRTRAQVCKDWVESGFLEVVDFSNKARKYKLTSPYEKLLK